MHENPGSTFEVEPGVEIYYETRGEGPPLLFIPGWTFTTEVFTHQVAHFSEDYQVITYDHRSVGRSTVTPYGNNYVTHGADLAKLIETLELEDVVLVGWSFGCLDAWSYIKQEGLDNVRAMVAIDLSPTPLSTDEDDWVEGPLEEIRVFYNEFLQSPQGYRNFLTAYITEVMIQRELEVEELFWLVDQAQKTPYWIAAALFASGEFTDHMTEAKLVDASIPSMYVIAEHWAETAEPFVKAHLPNTKTHVLGGHMMFWEHAERFNAILDAFLADL
jgi:pimeloyl-ACP methyl ester carboxylesterase